MFWKKKWIKVKNRLFHLENVKEISATHCNLHIKFYDGKEDNISGEENEINEIFDEIKDGIYS